jgi:lysozyme family protein
MLQTQNPYSRERIDALTTMLAGMDARGRQAYAAQHRNDPAVIATAVHVNNTVKAAERAKAMQAAGPMPTVVDQNLAAMTSAPAPAPVAQTQLPENQGIAQIPTPNIRALADGGIAGYEDDEEGMATGGMGGMFNFAQQSEPVVRMADGGMAGYTPGFNKIGSVNAAFEDALQNTLKYEGGFVADDAGKGPSNFGINKTANPDVDIKNLTKDKARELYKKRYWDVIGGDALAAKNPALAKVAFDTAVNLGPEKAKSIIAQAKDDPSQILNLRQAHYNDLLETNPNKFGKFEKSWNNRMADLATKIIPSAQAGELPKPAAAPAPAQLEKAGLESTDAGSNVLRGMVTANTGINALQAGKDVLNAGFKPGTTAGQAGRVLGTAAAVPQAVMLGGVAATKKAMNDLQYMSEDQRRALTANPMLSAMSGDAGLASAIMDAAANNPEGPSKMPYSQQMANVGKTILQHPDIDRMREANKAKTEKAKVASYDPNNMVPISPDEFGSAVGIPEPALPKPEEKAVVEAAKEATPAKERKGFNNDDLLTLGLSLLANKSPNFMTALGEAGLATVAGKKEREKIEREEAKLKGSEELQKAQAKYYGSYADAIERGAKEKNEQLQAEQLVQKHMESWEKNNKIASIQDPMARLQEENRARQQIYANLGLKPIMAGQASPAGAGDFKIVGVR